MNKTRLMRAFVFIFAIMLSVSVFAPTTALAAGQDGTVNIVTPGNYANGKPVERQQGEKIDLWFQFVDNEYQGWVWSEADYFVTKSDVTANFGGWQGAQLANVGINKKISGFTRFYLDDGTKTATQEYRGILDTTSLAPGEYKIWVALTATTWTSYYDTRNFIVKAADISPTPPPTATAVTGVKLNKKTLSLVKGKNYTLKETVSPSNAKNKAVTWKSSNPKVATVKNGKVTAKAKGTATINVITKDGSKKATCKVTVGKVLAKKITLKKTATVKKGKKLTLKPTITPKNTDPKTVSWTSSDKKIATVSSKGVVKGINAGKATITAKTWNGKTAKCTVTVTGKTATMSVTSAGITNDVIAEKYGMYGSQQSGGIPTLSLPLTIKNAPSGTKYYAVFMDDPDGGNWIHWMAANITDPEIPENASIKNASKMVQGKNDFGTTGYGGPTPPDKTHSYSITVYALKSKVSLSNGFTKSQFTSAIDGKVLAKTTIKAKYIRK